MPFFTRQHPDANPVEAVQWFPGRSTAGIADEWPGHPGGGGLLPSPPHAYLTTRKGRFTIFASDWIITEPSGEQHVCHDLLFQQGYTLVSDAPEELSANLAG